MKLVKHIQQGQLIYFTQNNDSISVSENQHYRWLAFDNVVQSMMLKRQPWQLTFPHQISLLSPLLFFQPQKVVEFGLGGGNLARFLLHYLPDLTLHTIEYSTAWLKPDGKWCRWWRLNVTMCRWRWEVQTPSPQSEQTIPS